MCDLLNFSFWTDEGAEPFSVDFEGRLYTGYWSLCACLNRAIREGVRITDFCFISLASDEELQRVFRPSAGSPVPMLGTRIELLRQASKVLLDRYGGSFANCIAEAAGDAFALIDLVAREFPSFLDVASYKGRPVHMLKRAQILVADLWACFEGSSYGEFRNINGITMFADYRVPQILHHWGVLEYSDALMLKLVGREDLAQGCEMEVELRGCSIQAVEGIVRAIRARSPECRVNAILVDFYLWDLAQELKGRLERTPFHRTRSVYY